MSNGELNSSLTVPVILAIETATRAGSVAVARGETVLAARIGDADASHSTDLISSIDQALQEANVKLAEVGLFAAAIGPGSFTGLRIGLATVKSLAVSLNRKCVGVPTLAALAHASGAAERIIALLPAGRGEVFAQMFTVQDHAVTPLDEPAHLSPQALLKKYGDYRHVTWAGEGAHSQAAFLSAAAKEKGIDLQEWHRLQSSNSTVDSDAPNSDGWTLAPPIQRLAEAIGVLAFREWRMENVIEPEELRANYVRASDAELKSHA
jgi:tRNA threonylcarbamoyladenosine biosynthesis protein TsaB